MNLHLLRVLVWVATIVYVCNSFYELIFVTCGVFLALASVDFYNAIARQK